MNNTVIKNKLISNNINEIYEAINEIHNSDTLPSEDVIQVAKNLLNHSDYEIRRRIIFTFVLHFAVIDFVPLLFEMAEGKEEDEIVLGTVISSLGRIAIVYNKYKDDILKVLAKIALDKNQDEDIRGEAYNNALYGAGLINKKEFASRTDDIEELDVDWDWLNSIKDL